MPIFLQFYHSHTTLLHQIGYGLQHKQEIVTDTLFYYDILFS